jgi:hypothetical protein
MTAAAASDCASQIASRVVAIDEFPVRHHRRRKCLFAPKCGAVAVEESDIVGQQVQSGVEVASDQRIDKGRHTGLRRGSDTRPMPNGPQGRERPADVIGNAVHVMQIATRQLEIFARR